MALVDEASDRDSLTRGFLFADLRGYTEYVERHGGEAAAQLLDRYRELVREQVARFRGAEIKTEGDSFYVVFPSVSGAVRAGLAIIEVATADSTTVPGHPIRVGIGVHAGETVETTEGYVGSAVNIAARLCSQARAGELLVSDTVRVLTATVVRAQFVSRGRQHLKGIAEPMQVFAVIGSADAGTTPVARRPVAHLRPVLAAVAAVAALALVAAFALGNRGQVPGSSSAAASSASASSASAQAFAPTPRPSSGLTGSDRQLIELVPSDIATHCRPASDEATNPSSATFRCDLPLGSGADTVWWDRFEATGLTVLALDRIAASRDLPDTPCSADVHEGQGEWDLGTTFSGRRLCWMQEGAAWTAWTYLDEQVLARAVRADGDGGQLEGWWTDVAPFLNSR